MKRILLLLIAITLLVLCGCQAQNNGVATDASKQATFPPVDDNAGIPEDNRNESNSAVDLSTQSNEYDDAQKDDSLRELIKNGDCMINHLDFSDTKTADECQTEAMENVKTWIEPIGFPGYMTNEIGFTGMSFLDNSSYVRHYIDFCFDQEAGKWIEYRVIFSDEFDAIQVDRLALRIQGIYGVKLDEDDLRDIIGEFKDTIYHMEPKTKEEFTIYNQDGTYIELYKNFNGHDYEIGLISSHNKDR